MLIKRFAKSIVLLIVLAMLSGCGGNPSTQSAPNEPNQDVQVTETSNDVVTFDETIHINNCGGKAESKQVVQRSFSTNIEGAAQLKVGYEIVEGSVTAKYGQYRNISKSQELSAPAGTDMEIILRWTEQTWVGSITANGSSGTYNVHVPVSVEQVSSQDLGCGGSAPIVPNNPPTATPYVAPPVQVHSTTSPSQLLSDGDTAYGDGLSLKVTVICIVCGSDVTWDPLLNVKFVLTNTSSKSIIIPKFGGEDPYVSLDTGEKLYSWTSIGWCDRENFIESQSISPGDSIKWEWGFKLKNNECGGIGSMLPLPNASRIMTLYFPEIGDRFSGAIWQIEIPR